MNAARQIISAGVAKAGGGDLKLERLDADVDAVAKEFNVEPSQLAGWIAHLLAARSDSADPLHLWAMICLEKEQPSAARIAELARSITDSKPAGDPSALAALANARVIIDYARVGPYFNWMPDGEAFGTGPVRVGEVELSDDPRRPIAGVYSYSAAVRDRRFAGLKPAAGVTGEPTRYGGAIHAGRSIRTPTFTVQSGLVYSLVVGPGFGYAVVDSHRLNNGPLHEALIHKWSAAGPKPRWVAHDLRAYRGHTAHVEFSATEAEPLAVLTVVEAERQPADLGQANEEIQESIRRAIEGPFGLDREIRDLLSRANRKLAEPESLKSIDRDTAELADWLVRHFDLVAPRDPAVRASVVAAARPYIDARKRLVAQIRRESRHAIAIWDGTGVDEFLLIRGNSNTPGEKVPRRFLEAIAGPKQQPIEHGSGRLVLARRMTDPANPLLSRVIVNRAWHHLFGRGIVASCDNFGVLGEKPTHPELLDYLSREFIDDGWSIKRLIRRIVLSSAYQMASTPEPSGDELDPQNLLWHRRQVRRLEGEAIRDAILAVSGRLDRSMHGPSVPIHLTEFLEGRGRPPSGPVDGNGRRSIYLSVRRNFLSPMLQAFDAPIPQSTIGRRNVSNVPAQALILLNDPFVAQQAEVWAKRTLAEPLMIDERLARLYETAFARPPSESELARGREFLMAQVTSRNGHVDSQAESRAWADLCHALFNLKEFVFVP